VGTLQRIAVFPERGISILSVCDLPQIYDLDVNLDNVDYFIRYHSHPVDVTPSAQDISTGVQQFIELPSTTRYLQAIYTKRAIYKKMEVPEFLWWEHHR